MKPFVQFVEEPLRFALEQLIDLIELIELLEPLVVFIRISLNLMGFTVV